MSILQTVTPESATGEVAEIYAQIKNAWGHVPAAIQVFSANPFLLRHQWEYYGSVMQHPTLSMPLTACIRMLVSEAGNCDYCIDMNAGMLINMAGWTPDQVAATRADFNNSPLGPAEKTLLGLVLKATRDSNRISTSDLDAARAAGWSDSDILTP
jgi:alkylhydroperoxidase family enzyme